MSFSDLHFFFVKIAGNRVDMTIIITDSSFDHLNRTDLLNIGQVGVIILVKPILANH